MMEVIEGTWEEIKSHDHELRGRRFRLTPLPEQTAQTTPISEDASRSIKAMKAYLEERSRQSGRRETSGEDTDALLRQARDGGMYGIEPGDSD